MSNKDKHYHFFASNFVIDRISPVLSTNTERQAVFEDISKSIPSEPEVKIYKDSLKVLLARIMAEFITGFQWLSKVVPGHIPHIYQEEMAKPSEMDSLPLSLNNECSYEGCLHILQEYTDWINKCYRKAGRGIQNVLFFCFNCIEKV